MVFETLAIRKEGAALFVEIAAPPMNLLGPELARDLVKTFLGAKFTNEERHLRRLGKVAKMEDKFCDS